MPPDSEIHAFVRDLAATKTPAIVCNQYAHARPDNAIRRDNLSLYLQLMSRRAPGALLVGEAAGHRGCRLTGIPFASEALLLYGVPGHDLLGEARGFRASGERPGLSHEQSATLVWQALGQLDALPLLWNAYPFHPHPPEDPWANRTPTSAEISSGSDFLLRLIELFRVALVVGVGNHAGKSLRELRQAGRLPEVLALHQVRHPAHGGKRAFSAGVHDLLAVC